MYHEKVNVNLFFIQLILIQALIKSYGDEKEKTEYKAW